MQRAEPDDKLWYASHHPDRLMTLPAGTRPAAQYSRNKAVGHHPSRVGYAAWPRGGQGARCDPDGLPLHPPDGPDPLAALSSPATCSARSLNRSRRPGSSAAQDRQRACLPRSATHQREVLLLRTCPEPDLRISRIRLSDKTSRLHPRHVVPKSAQAYEPEVPSRLWRSCARSVQRSFCGGFAPHKL